MLKTKTKSLIIIIFSLISLIGANSVALALDDGPPPEIKIDAPPPSITINTSCAENNLIDNDSRLCQNGSFILCEASKEGIKSKDSARECKSGKWTQVSTPNPTPPGNGGQTGNPGQPGSNPGGDGNPNPNPPKEDKIKITKSDVYPKGFNPTVNSAKITYTINKEAIIEIKIVDSSGQAVTKLIEDKKISKGEYSINWYGTVDNKQSGTVLSPGTYEYKITAKNPSNANVEDTADGEINLIYFVPPSDNSQYDNYGEANKPIDTFQAKATQTLQNSTTGITAKTGPDTMIYFIFLLIGPIFYTALAYRKSRHVK